MGPHLHCKHHPLGLSKMQCLKHAFYYALRPTAHRQAAGLYGLRLCCRCHPL